MSGFNNDVVGGEGTLIRPVVQSPDFSIAGKTGWAIMRDGSAYFFDVTAEGTVTASGFEGTDFIIDTAGIFMYSGPI